MTATTIAQHVSRARAERLVATVRFICHVVATIAVAGTATTLADTFPLLVTVPWMIVSAILDRGARRSGHLPFAKLLLVADLLFAGSLILMTGGGASPFFPFLLLTTFGASVLFGRRGMAWSAAGTVIVYIATTMIAATHVTLDLRTVIVRIGFLIIIWSIIVRRAEHEMRTNADLEQLANWPRLSAFDRKNGIRVLLAHASATLRSPRTALAWTENDGSAFVATYDSRDDAFTLDEDAEDETDIDAGMRTEFVSQTGRGWLLAVDPSAADHDDRRLAEIVARLVSSGLDQINVASMLREAAASDERLRLSRDLHDGLLQTLGGVAMQAQSARGLVARDPQAAQERLEGIVLQLTRGQRDLREFVDALRPELRLRREPLHARLRNLGAAIALQWSVAVQLDADRELDALDGAVGEHVVSLTGEALANAARHAQAKRVDAKVSIEGTAVRIDVVDDGRGFPFRGRYELHELVASGQGPWSLKERVRALGGELAIESSSAGSRVELRVPRRAEG
jgi:signal transduction histidine kinase